MYLLLFVPFFLVVFFFVLFVLSSVALVVPLVVFMALLADDAPTYYLMLKVRGFLCVEFYHLQKISNACKGHKFQVKPSSFLVLAA